LPKKINGDVDVEIYFYTDCVWSYTYLSVFNMAYAGNSTNTNHSICSIGRIDELKNNPNYFNALIENKSGLKGKYMIVLKWWHNPNGHPVFKINELLLHGYIGFHKKVFLTETILFM
jgi:hypothetical protein